MVCRVCFVKGAGFELAMDWWMIDQGFFLGLVDKGIEDRNGF